jgi:hypothetical protein
MKTVRTPDARFENLPGYPFEPHYSEVPNGEGGRCGSTTSTRVRATARSFSASTASRRGPTSTGR